jgi:hypothetical protein
MSIFWKAATAAMLAAGAIAASPASAGVTIESLEGNFTYGYNNTVGGGQLSMQNGTIVYNIDGKSYTGSINILLSTATYLGGITSDSMGFALDSVSICDASCTSAAESYMMALGYNSGSYASSAAQWTGLSAGSDWQSLTLGNLTASNVFSFSTTSSPFTVNSSSVLASNIAIANSIAAALSGYTIDMSLDSGTLTGGRPTTSLSFTTGTPPAPVPEPASWALMIVGFGLTGAALRARRQTVAFA